MIQDGDLFFLVPACILTLFAGEMLGGSENGLQIVLEDLEAKLPGPPCRVQQLLPRHRTGMLLDKLMPEVPKWVRYRACEPALETTVAALQVAWRFLSFLFQVF